MTLDQIFQVMDHIVSAVIFFGALIAFLLRTWISEAIKNKFSKAVGQELEAQKHSLNRELEAYKVTLLRDLEQFRADIDIKRTIALQTASAKLNALRAFFSVLSNFTNTALAFPTQSIANRPTALINLSKKFTAYGEAYQEAEIFLPQPLRLAIPAHVVPLMAFVTQYAEEGAPVLAADSPLIQPFIDKNIEVHELLQQEVEAVGL